MSGELLRAVLTRFLPLVALACQAAPTARRPEPEIVGPRLRAAQEAAPPGDVTLSINIALIQSQPLGARVIAMMARLPEWRQFLSRSSLDVSRDVEWVMLTGPSLADARKDLLVIRYSASDGDVERAIVALTQGQSIALGVPALKAWRFEAGGVERAFLLAQEHLLLVSPARHANAYARTAHDVSLGVAFSRGEAARLRVVRPGRWPALVPEAVTELRLSLVATADGGAALEGEADCSDASEAVGVATELQRRATAGSPSENAMSPYAGLETRAEGSRVLVHLAFAHERLEELVELVSSYLDVTSHRGR